MRHGFVENENLHYLCRQDIMESQEIIMPLACKNKLGCKALIEKF